MVPIGDGFIPVEEEEIASIEHRLGATLPREYREFLKQFGASMFAAYVDFSLADSRPIYSGDPSVPIREHQEGHFSAFYGSKGDPFLQLEREISVYKGRMPESIIPIGEDGAGNQICIGIKGQERGKIFYWDHNHEWDEEDYLEDYGAPMPVDAEFQNIYLVADSFEEFLGRLQISDM